MNGLDLVNEYAAQEEALGPGVYQIIFNITTPTDVEAIKETLADHGIKTYKVDQRVTGDGYAVDVVYRKPDPGDGISFLPVAVIPLIGFVLASALVGITIFKIGDIAEGLMKLVLVAGGVAVVVMMANNYTKRKA
jgi:hypothetical protein